MSRPVMIPSFTGGYLRRRLTSYSWTRRSGVVLGLLSSFLLGIIFYADKPGTTTNPGIPIEDIVVMTIGIPWLLYVVLKWLKRATADVSPVISIETAGNNLIVKRESGEPQAIAFDEIQHCFVYELRNVPRRISILALTQRGRETLDMDNIEPRLIKDIADLVFPVTLNRGVRRVFLYPETIMYGIASIMFFFITTCVLATPLIRWIRFGFALNSTPNNEISHVLVRLAFAGIALLGFLIFWGMKENYRSLIKYKL